MREPLKALLPVCLLYCKWAVRLFPLAGTQIYMQRLQPNPHTMHMQVALPAADAAAAKPLPGR